MEGLDKISKFAEDLNPYIKTSKLRKFYGEVKRIQVKGISENSEKIAFRMLKPKLAYAVGRESKDEAIALRCLNEFISEGLNIVDKSFGDAKIEKLYYNNFVNLFESIIAFHKYHGGKDK
ncbi:type III-A CRISPR-associated protein Csm2 [Pleomorphovibrio marinus]|uniref:type III-A CRISPR-associated protein Csm2 n=1 Tax=Pleomorphovibrio marinus TaxID=2164132 RepID=UPI00130099DF|nr:type III-A CRISPR-associated protein Csm2 [Pleomorphovibrio marinus]